MKDKISGIYSITDLFNPKNVYIGSSKNIKRRWAKHKADLRHYRHNNIILQRIYNKHGMDNLRFDIVEKCGPDKLFEREEFFINSIGTINIGSVGGGDNLTKNPNKKDICKRISETLKEGYRTGRIKRQHRFGKDNPHYNGGPKRCPICGKILSNKEYTTCSECRDRTGKNNPFYGKHHSEETIEKIRNANKGKVNVDQQKSVMCNGVKFVSLSEAGRTLNVSTATILNRCRSDNPKFSGYYYC